MGAKLAGQLAKSRSNRLGWFPPRLVANRVYLIPNALLREEPINLQVKAAAPLGRFVHVDEVGAPPRCRNLIDDPPRQLVAFTCGRGGRSRSGRRPLKRANGLRCSRIAGKRV